MEEKRTLLSALASVQAELKVGKGRKNAYGGFMYRSCADIFEDVKSHYTSTFTDYSLRRANMVWRISKHNARTHGRPFVFRECMVHKKSFEVKDR